MALKNEQPKSKPKQEQSFEKGTQPAIPSKPMDELIQPHSGLNPLKTEMNKVGRSNVGKKTEHDLRETLPGTPAKAAEIRESHAKGGNNQPKIGPQTAMDVAQDLRSPIQNVIKRAFRNMQMVAFAVDEINKAYRLAKNLSKKKRPPKKSRKKVVDTYKLVREDAEMRKHHQHSSKLLDSMKVSYKDLLYNLDELKNLHKSLELRLDDLKTQYTAMLTHRSTLSELLNDSTFKAAETFFLQHLTPALVPQFKESLQLAKERNHQHRSTHSNVVEAENQSLFDLHFKLTPAKQSRIASMMQELNKADSDQTKTLEDIYRAHPAEYHLLCVLAENNQLELVDAKSQSLLQHIHCDPNVQTCKQELSHHDKTMSGLARDIKELEIYKRELEKELQTVGTQMRRAGNAMDDSQQQVQSINNWLPKLQPKPSGSGKKDLLEEQQRMSTLGTQLKATPFTSGQQQSPATKSSYTTPTPFNMNNVPPKG